MAAASSIADKTILDLASLGGIRSKIIGLGRAYLQRLVSAPSSVLPVSLVSLRRRHPRIAQVEIVRLADAELLHFLHLGLQLRRRLLALTFARLRL